MTEPLLLTAAEARARLGIGEKVFRRHVRAQDIPAVMIGKRRKYDPADLFAFVHRQKQAAQCQSTGPKSRRIGTTISNSEAYDFSAARALRTAMRRGKSRPQSGQKPQRRAQTSGDRK